MQERSFEEKIEDGGNVAVDIFMKYIEGEMDENPLRFVQAGRMVAIAIKMKHLQQIKAQVERSQALRLAHLLQDEETRKRYIEATNPEVKQLTAKRPK